MDLKRISVGNFKSLYDTSFEPGRSMCSLEQTAQANQQRWKLLGF